MKYLCIGNVEEFKKVKAQLGKEAEYINEPDALKEYDGKSRLVLMKQYYLSPSYRNGTQEALDMYFNNNKVDDYSKEG